MASDILIAQFLITLSAVHEELIKNHKYNVRGATSADHSLGSATFESLVDEISISQPQSVLVLEK